MAKEITIELQEPIVGHKGMIRTIKLREPKATDFFDLGELQLVTHDGNGGVVYMERPGIYREYTERCLIEPKDTTAVMAQISMADGFKIKEAVQSFFVDARFQASPTSPSSSSSSDGATRPQSEA